MNDDNNDWNIPQDEGTTPQLLINVILGDIEARWEVWSWEGLEGQSLIFETKSLEDMNDNELEKLVRSTGLAEPDSEMTTGRNADLTFVNFNFEDSSPDCDGHFNRTEGERGQARQERLQWISDHNTREVNRAHAKKVERGKKGRRQG